MDNHKTVYNVLAFIEDAAEQYADKAAFQAENGQITYGQLLEQVNRMGYRLSVRLSAVRKPIVVLMEKCVECLVAFFAVAASGNFYVCIDSKMAPERIGKILENLCPAGIVKRQA